MSLTAFVTTLQMDFGTSFVEAKTTHIEKDLLLSHFFYGASLASYMRHVRVPKFVLRNSMSFEYFESSATFMFRVTHLDDMAFASC